jgi:hypothetical protein
VEFVLMKYTHSLLGLGDRATLCDVLRTERFRNFRYRAEAALLRVAVAVLPMRLIAALDVWCLAIEAQLGERVRRWRAGIGPRRLSDVITYVSARPRGGSADGL